VLEIDASPPFDVSPWHYPRLWVLPAQDSLELRYSSLYGNEPRGSIPIDVKPRGISFLVPYTALRDDDGLIRYRLGVLAVTKVDESGAVRALTDTYLGDTLPST
jgi:hypothetical protein